MGKTKYCGDVRKALSERLCHPSESLRSYIVRSFDNSIQPAIREALGKTSEQLQEMLDHSLAVQIDDEKPISTREAPIFSVAEVVDKVSLNYARKYKIKIASHWES